MHLNITLWLHRGRLKAAILSSWTTFDCLIFKIKTTWIHACYHISVGAHFFHLLNDSFIKHLYFCFTSLNMSIVAISITFGFFRIWCLIFWSRFYNLLLLFLSYFKAIVNVCIINEIFRGCYSILLGRLTPLFLFIISKTDSLVKV